MKTFILALTSTFALALFFLAALALTGCGVKHEGVDNSPPKIDHDLKGFSSPYGTFNVNQTSVFFWPRGITEDQAEVMVGIVNGASEKADPFMIDAATLTQEQHQLQASWDKIDCVSHYAILQPGQDPMDVDSVTAWKDEKDAGNPAELHECQANQARRQAIPALQDADLKSALPYLALIQSTIDVDPNHPVNSQTLDGMQLTINPDNSVAIVLKNFMTPGFSPSTAKGDIINAVWNPNLSQLVFDVVVTKSVSSSVTQDLPQGPVIHFALGRTFDNGPLARFTGDMNLMSGGQVLRHGSSRIDAFPPSN